MENTATNFRKKVSRSQVMKDAYKRMKSLGESFSVAQKASWDAHKKEVFAHNKADELVAMWEKRCNSVDLYEYAEVKKKVDDVVVVFKATATELFNKGVTELGSATDIFVTIVKNVKKVPSYKQLKAAICGAWENGVETIKSL